LPDRAQNPIKSKIKQQGRPSISVKSNRTRLAGKLLKLRALRLCFREKDKISDYSQNRACFRSGEIRVLDSTAKLERTIAFGAVDRKL